MSVPEMIYMTYDPKTRKSEKIDTSDFVPGQIVMTLYWSKTLKRYATVPGMALYRVNDDLSLTNVED